MKNDSEPTKQQLELAKQAAGLGIWEWCIEEDELIWDDRTIELFGFTPDAGVKEFYETVHPQDRDRVRQAVNRTLETGEPYDIRFRIQKENTSCWIEAHGTCTMTNESTPERMIGSVQDITELMKARNALRESKENYELMFDNVQDAIFLIDVGRSQDKLTFTFTRLNSSYEEKTGIKNEDVVGYTPDELFDDEMAAELKENYRRCVNARETIRYTEELELPKGSGTWRTELTPLIRDGKVEAILGATRDITEEVSRKRELNFFREAMQQNPDEIYMLDPETARFTDVTESVEDMLGYTREELLSMKAHDVNPNIGEDINWEKHVAELKRQGPKTVETTHRRKDGTTFPVEIHVAYIEVEGTERLIATARNITEREEARQQIQAQQNFLERINNQLPGVTFQFKRHPDGSFSFPYLSDGLKDLCGISSDRAMRNVKEAFENMHPDDRDAFFESVRKSAETLSTWRQEIRVRHPEQGLKWIRGSSTPERLEDGSVVWSGIMVDVSDEKQNELELSHQKKRFQTLFKEAPIGLLEEDWSGVKTYIQQLDRPDNKDLRSYLEKHPEIVREAAGKIDLLLANKTAVQLTGAGREDQLKRQFENLFIEDTCERLREKIIELWNGKTTFSSSMKIQRFDGEERHVLVDLLVVPEHERDWSRLFVSLRDVSEQKWMEQTLRQSEQRYRTLFEESNEAFLIVGLNDEILDVNHACCDLLGYTRDELIGMNRKEIAAPEVIEQSEEKGIVRSHLDKHGDSVFQTYFIHRDSTRIPVETSKTPVNFGGRKAVMDCVRDRTELERMRRKSQMKSTFVSQVTHDLRTPLNSISGMGNLLMDTELSAEQQNYLRTILNSARNMEHLTNDILDLDRIERGELTLNNQQFNPGNLLGEVMSLYIQQMNERNIVMNSRISDDVPDQLIGDPDRLKQILHNLVDNAVKHTREGSIEIYVNVRDRTPSGVTLAFSVSDTGSGIPESKLDDIFKQHEQVLDMDTENPEGLGLGLSICQHLVEMMNGTISVESEVEKGSTFTFTVDLKEAKATSSTLSDDIEVLLVEDNALVRKVFRKYLETHGVNVDELESGKAALEELRQSNGDLYDVVFMDQRMDEMLGTDVLQKVSDAPDGIDPGRIYLVSGDPREKLEELAGSIPFAGVLEKPISESALVNAITSVVLFPDRSNDRTKINELQKEIKSRKPDSLHILVADDNFETRTLLNKLLFPVADQLTFVWDGKQAVDRRSEQPDLVLMDLEMPRMDGIEAMERIRNQESKSELSHVPIICQTAKAMKHVEEQTMKAGADLFLRKPIQRVKLYRAIRDVLS